MNDSEFRAFLDLLMCSDPWPVLLDSGQIILENFANQEAKKRGYETWVVAFHEFKLPEGE